MATPQPDGLGMANAMCNSLKRASLAAHDISYVNLHGTATKTNDATEDKAVVNTLGTCVPCSSTKGWTGHTLGAAGITEAVISVICLNEQLIPNVDKPQPNRNDLTLKQRDASHQASESS